LANARSVPGWRIRTLGALALLAIGGQSAGGAEDASKRPGRYKLGPLYVTPRLELRNAGVDTNVFNSASNEVSDTTVVLRPALLGALPVGRRIRLTGQGYLDLNYFSEQRSERSTDFGGEGRAEVIVGPFTVFGGGGGARARQRFAIDLDERVLRHERWLSAGMRIQFGQRLSSTFSGSTRAYDFESVELGDANVKEALDRDQRSAQGQLRYALTRQTTVLASSEVIEDRFAAALPVSEETGLPQTSRTVLSFRHLLGVELGERAIITGRALGGLRELRSGAGIPSYRGPALAVSVAVPLLRFGRLDCQAERDVLYSIERARSLDDRLRNTYVWTRLQATASIHLPFDLLGRMTLARDDASYQQPYVRDGVSLERVDHLWTGGGSLLRRLGDRLRLGGTVMWVERTSNFPEFSYRGLRYGLQGEILP
jgi:hypothetical protein